MNEEYNKLTGISDKLIKNASNTFAMIPPNLIQVTEEALKLRVGKRLVEFQKQDKEMAMEFVSKDNNVKKDTIQIGNSWFSKDFLEEMKQIIKILEIGYCDYEIYEREEEKGDYPLIFRFEGNHYFLLAPKDKTKALERMKDD